MKLYQTDPLSNFTSPGTGRSGLSFTILADCLIMFCFALFAIAACNGVLAISANGTELDSDLTTYIQGIVATNYHQDFLADPLLSKLTYTAYIANALCAFASLLCPQDMARGILLAGGYVVFLHFASFYLLGRWIFGRPALALLLSLLCSGVTVWIEWGTFWGVLQSDPVPRSLFAALWPFALIAAIHGMGRQWPRPLVMLACGLGIYVNPVNSLACGAMFFAAFFFNPVPGGQIIENRNPKAIDFFHPLRDGQEEHKVSISSHLIWLGIALFLFLLPVFHFLWPAFNTKSLAPDEVEVLRQVLDLRWHEDYGQLFTRLLNLFRPTSEFSILPTLLPGLLCWFVVNKLRRQQRDTVSADYPCRWGRLFTLASMYPFFLLGLCFTVCVSLAEAALLPPDRLPQGHELVRGLRYLIPLSWLMIVAMVALISARLPVVAWIASVFTLGLILFFASDRQLIAANYTLAKLTGCGNALSRTAEEYENQALAKRKMIEKLALTVPKGELVYAESDAAIVRYIAHLPAVPNFKDGSPVYYDRNVELAHKWLEWRALEKEKYGYLKIWEKSGARWMLTDRLNDIELLASKGEIVWQEAGRLLVKAK